MCHYLIFQAKDYEQIPTELQGEELLLNTSHWPQLDRVAIV